MGRRQTALRLLTENYPLTETQAKALYDSSRKAGEFEPFDGSTERWFEERLEPSMVLLDHRDYTKALINALKVAQHLAATDYGTSRQRDLGQLWTDTTRGFLGELGVIRFFEQNWGILLDVDYSLGQLEEYLSSDIEGCLLPDGGYQPLGEEISVKTTKFRGMWLDITGAQIDHSDAFILAKIAIRRDHFVAYLKEVGLFDEILFDEGRAVNVLEEEEVVQIRQDLPEFRDVPCYVAGFLRKPIEKLGVTSYRERNTRDGDLKGYTITGYLGRLDEGEPVEVPEVMEDEDVEFEGIRHFSNARHFVSDTGNLQYRLEDWQELVGGMTAGRAPTITS